jgi:hypothetical protein
MTDEVKAAVFGNVGSMVVFRVGATDAEIFEKEFAPYFVLDDIVNLGFTQIYLRLMIDGVGSRPFSAKTLGPIKKPNESFAEEIIQGTRVKYSKKVLDAEEEIKEWYTPKVIPKTETKGGVVSLSEEVKDKRTPINDVYSERGSERFPDRKPERRTENKREEARSIQSSPVTRYDLKSSEKEVVREVQKEHVENAKSELISEVKDTKTPKKEEVEKKEMLKESVASFVPAMTLSEPPQEEVEREQKKAPFTSKGSSLKEALLRVLEEKKAEDEKSLEKRTSPELLPLVDKEESPKSGEDAHKKKRESVAHITEIDEDILKPLIEETPL